MEPEVSRLQAAQRAVNSIGLGFDITQDISFDNCKWGSRLILVNEEQCRDLEIPGGVSIPNVPNSIKCVKGESIRIHSDVLTLMQMIEHFNQEMCLGGKIASGHFCASFGLSGQYLQHLASRSMSLAYDGWFVKRYAIELEKHQLELPDHVKEAVPSSWDPEAIARFIERFGTHIVVGVSMGGKDVLYVRQEEHSSGSIKKFMNDAASMEFKDSVDNHCPDTVDLRNKKENHFVIHSRRGGSSQKMNHSEWLDTIDSEPDVISMLLIPLASLFKNIHGTGFVSHAINLYSRYKPPIESLHHFLEFQLPRQWAPVLSSTSLNGSRRKHDQMNIWLRFRILGPKLYINTIPVDVGNRPVTGLRLLLEGTRSNRLALCLQHLSSLPMSLPLSDNANAYLSCDSYSSTSYRCTSHEKVKRNCFSYVCTAPVESDDSVSIVTGAQLQVEKNCLLLRLRFSKVVGATLQRPPEWDQPSSLGQLSNKSRGVFAFMISRQENKDTPKPGDVTIGSAVYPSGPPVRVHAPYFQKFVDTTEMIRGPEHTPGHWVVSGARFSVQNAKIFLYVKYSLLSFV